MSGKSSISEHEKKKIMTFTACSVAEDVIGIAMNEYDDVTVYKMIMCFTALMATKKVKDITSEDIEWTLKYITENGHQ